MEKYNKNKEKRKLKFDAPISSLLEQLSQYYPTLSVYDIIVAGLEELLAQNRRIEMHTMKTSERIRFLSDHNQGGFSLVGVSTLEKWSDETNKLEAENARLLELLRRYEWKGQNGTCPDCGWTAITGHPSLCELNKAIEGGDNAS